MCGVAGLVGEVDSGPGIDVLVRRMTNTLAHRGPDGDGHWVDRSRRVALGHRRLAIIDLSDLGKQPMASASQRFHITFNGEIYNFEDLRKELVERGHTFRGRADTEVLLASIEEWGVRKAVERLVGMFAFAVWDHVTSTLTLARDRLGKKPIYYGGVRGCFAFASELKALKALPGFSTAISRDALTLYLRHNHVPAPYSIYESVAKLDAGTILDVKLLARSYVVQQPVRYWSPREVFAKAANDPFRGDLGEAAEEVETVLSDAVRLRMISDVPLGAFLSGGIDSSLVVALMQKHSMRPIRTFTVGFEERAFNEADQARSVARHLHTDHTEVFLKPTDALRVIPELQVVYDEPFSDSSQIPTLLVCRTARDFVTVAVSGDGGDESFGGYNRYVWWRRLWGASRRMPPMLRPLAQKAICSVSTETWDKIVQCISTWLPARYRFRSIGDRLYKVADLIGSEEPLALYKSLVSLYQAPSSVVIGGSEPATGLSVCMPERSIDEFTSDMMMLDLATYLPDDILVKVDRASMAVSLEVRAPLLDHRVVELAARLPVQHKIAGNKGKIVLRRVLEQYVPRQLFDRPKTGFGVPIGAWLRGPLRGWAEDLLNERKLREDGLFEPAIVRRQWNEHVSGVGQWHYQMWAVLMFQAWFRAQDSDGDSLSSATALRAHS